MDVQDALDRLEQQLCPIDGTKTHAVVEHDGDGQYAFELCDNQRPNRHTWRYERFVSEYDTNYFEGTFDPLIIEESLEEYGATV